MRLLRTPLPSITSCFLALNAVAPSSLKYWISVPGSGPSYRDLGFAFVRCVGGGSCGAHRGFEEIHSRGLFWWLSRLEPRWPARDMGIRTAEGKHRIRPDRGPAPNDNLADWRRGHKLSPNKARWRENKIITMSTRAAWSVTPSGCGAEPKRMWRQP